MMGSKARVFTPIPQLSLEDLVPQQHFYRQLDRVLDLAFVRDLVKDTYAVAGRPSIDPIVFFKLELVMFFEDIRSERLLMRLVADKLSVRWYVGYNLDEPLPEHSSLTRIRTRYGIEIFRRFFDAIVERCQQAGLVWGKECYFDATQVQANADVDSLTPRFALAVRHTAQAHLIALFPETLPTQEPVEPISPPRLPISTPSPLPPVLLIPESADDLTVANAQRHDWYAEGGRQHREQHGRRPRMADLRVSTTDPDATFMHRKGGGARLGYQTHYVVDGGKDRIILAALVTPAEVMENQPMLDLLWHTRFRWRLRPRHVTGDTTYGTLENIRAIEEEGIHAYVPLPNWEEKSPVWSPAHFQYEPEADQYRCPQGAFLVRIGGIERGTERQLYRAPASICNGCPMKSHCTTSHQGRSIHRSIGEAYYERVRAYHKRNPIAKRAANGKSGLSRSSPKPKIASHHVVDFQR